jgi:homoserine kinase type II
MTPDVLDEAAIAVLGGYAFPRPGMPRPIPAGFSGARLWRFDSSAGAFCLRAWPSAFPLKRLAYIHRLLARARAGGLAFVPRVEQARVGATWVQFHGRLWEVQEWLPGAADFHAASAPQRLAAACQALARLHQCWAAAEEGVVEVCPAVKRRLEAATEWRARWNAGWRPPRRLAPALTRAMADIPYRLGPWRRSRLRLQPCHGDPWRDNLLFDGDGLTGVVDYGAVKMDHPAADVARLIGSCVWYDADGWSIGLRAYRTVQPFSVEGEELARTLDVTGTAAAAARWVWWLEDQQRAPEDTAAAQRRLAELVRRLESTPPQPDG